MKKTAILLLPFLLICSFTFHTYFHSHCSIELNAKTGSGEVVLELFWHDLEVSLSKKNNKTIKITDKEINTYIKNYLKENLVLKDSLNKVFDFEFIGSELKPDEVDVYIEYKGLNSFQGLQLTNSLLVREFPAQVNKVNLKKGE